MVSFCNKIKKYIILNDKKNKIDEVEDDWPNIELENKEIDDILNLYLDITKDATKQCVDGGRAIYSRTSSLLTQSSTLAVASFGSISIIPSINMNNKLSYLLPYSIYGLSTSCLLWTVAALCAVIGMRTQKFGSISPKEESFKNQEMFSSSLSEVKLYILKSQFLAMKLSRNGSRKAAKWLNISAVLIAISPISGILVTVCFYLLSRHQPQNFQLKTWLFSYPEDLLSVVHYF